MQGLMLDTRGSWNCTRAEAFSKALIPEDTNTYKAVGNEEFLVTLETAARKHGLILTNEKLGMDRGGMRMFVTYQVEGKNFFGDRVQLMMGACNSYDKSLRVKVCFGAKVFVCSNLCFSHWTDETTGIGGEVGHKHMRFVNDNLWPRLDAALSQADNYRALQDEFYQRLADTNVSNTEVNDFLFRAGREKVIGRSMAWDIADEWDNQMRDPEDGGDREWHAEFQKRNAFNLLNAVTQVNKKRLDSNPVAGRIGTFGITNFFYQNFIENN